MSAGSQSRRHTARRPSAEGYESSYQRPRYDEIELTPDQKRVRAEKQREQRAAKKAKLAGM